MNPNRSTFSAKNTSPATPKMALPIHASTQEARIRILSTSAAPAKSRARVSGFDDSSKKILRDARAGALPETEHASSRTRHHPEKVNTIRYEAPKSARANHRAHESRAHAQYIRNRRFEAYSKATCAQADVTSPRHIQIPSHGSSNRNEEHADRPQRWNHGRKGQQNQT